MCKKKEKFQIKTLCLNDVLGIAIDQVLNENNLPLTSYYFWPRNDAWEVIRLELDSKSWILEHEKELILKKVTKASNDWKRKTDKKYKA